MKIERTKNAQRNIIFGSILKIYQIAVPFLVRTAMIYFMGVQYLGLDSLFTSILQVLNLAELGVGSAMVYSMYKPVAEDDKTTICALMKMYRMYYRIIGLVIAVVGLLLIPFVPKLVNDELPPELNIYVLYLLNLSVTVLSYWLFAYKNSLLQAYQRVDVSSKVTLITKTFQYGLQLLVLVAIKNYYVYVLVALSTQALTNIVTALIVTKMYPDYHPIGRLPKRQVQDINHRIRDLFTARLGGVVVGAADTMVISAFLGLSALAVYQNYYMIINAVYGFVRILIQSCTAGIGNSFVTESMEKNYRDFQKMTILFMMLINSAACCFLNLFQPFMKLWVGSEFMLAYPMVVLFVVYYISLECMELFSLYKDATGIWHQDRFRPLCEAGLNLIMNLIMVQFWGLYGILLSTILSMMLFSIPWLIHNLFTFVFQQDIKTYLGLIFANLGAILLSNLLTYAVCSQIYFSGILELATKLVISGGGSLLVYTIIFCHSKLFLEAIELLNRASGDHLNLFLKLLRAKQKN